MRNNRARYRLAVAPGQPAVSYVGYPPASWTSGALPGWVTDQFAAWPPGPQPAPDQPPARA